MPSKQNAEFVAPKAAGYLPSFELVLIEGKDAGDFLQRQTMNDVRELAAVGAWHWNGLLSAKGRVLALFALLYAGEQQYWLVLPDGDSAHWAQTLRQYVFRSKLTIQARADAQAFGTVEPGRPDLPSADRAVACGSGWLLDFSGDAARRTLAIGAERPAELLGPPADLQQADDAASDGGLASTAAEAARIAAAWAYEDLRHGLPHLPPPRRDSHTPHMLGLDRLQAFSVRKGCYPGQEIVARTHFLGKAKRSLQRLVSEQPFGEHVLCDGQPVAVLDRISVGNRHEAVAVMPASESTCTHAAGGDAVQRQAFCAGLARGPR